MSKIQKLIYANFSFPHSNISTRFFFFFERLIIDCINSHFPLALLFPLEFGQCKTQQEKKTQKREVTVVIALTNSLLSSGGDCFLYLDLLERSSVFTTVSFLYSKNNVFFFCIFSPKALPTLCWEQLPNSGTKNWNLHRVL